MRIASGVVDQFLYFVAVDSTDFTTRETGLSSFTVYRSRDGAAAAAMTTPTINETDVTNMPGVYELLLDEDMTVGSGNLSEAMVFHITQASMAPVSVEIELFSPANYTVGTVTTNTDMRGTDSAALATGVNVTQISGDSTAADNLEAMYDGTGYIDDTAPSSRSQVSNISTVGGGAVNFAADTDNVLGAIKSITFVGVQTTNTFANTKTLDSVYHVIDDTTNEIDLVYGFSVGGGFTGNQMSFDGYLSSSNDTLNILAYDFVGVSWDTIGSIAGQNGSTNISLTQPLLAQHTGTGSDVGKVYIRLQNTGQSNPTLNVDRLDVSAVSNLSAIGYEGGAVWLDTNSSNTNTEPRVDGTASNPVSTLAAARSLLTSLNTKIINCVPGSSFTLASDTSGIEFTGAGYVIALGGQDIGGARFFNAAISGIGTGSSRAVFKSCILIGATTLPIFAALPLNINNQTLTLSATGTHNLDHCFGTGTLNYGTAIGNTTVNLNHWSGDITIEAMGDTGTDIINIQGKGSFTEGTCAGGTANIAGLISKSGITNITISETARLDIPALNAEMDTAISDASLATAASLATVDTNVDSILVDTGTTLDAAIAVIDGNVDSVLIDTGTTIPALLPSALINGRMNSDIEAINDNTTAADNLSASALGIQTGACEGVPTTTVIQTDLSEATDDHFIGRVVVFTSGNAAQEATDITDYTGSTGTITVTALTTAPASTDTFVIV